ncbi:hypothetical protein Thimo_2154 [Thioflavicoccus mobilis 8321]|uniref:Uncharacterized protein n=1 Tax=Thioflavicoccus mobilis 8321 TaxID=765912 RepID=L0GVV3_9GAMM|nr:hypothetical protein [Thioflavicoccus mobilis]AGA90903.1 hypothetical protein Thimo_2154 [Thioflavicoccus mobilis 8321]
MPLILAGLALAAAGLGLLLAQAIRAIEPGIPLALTAFAVALAGIFLGVAGVVRRL